MFKELNILRIFLEEPSREFNVREIGRLLKISPATASKQLKEFHEKGILLEKRIKNIILYSANLDSQEYCDVKIFHNIRRIKDSGLLEELNKFYLKPAIILFGSASKGLDTETSDFDILIISEKTSEFPEREKFEKIINRKIQMFIVKNIKELKNEYLINNVINGIVIQGELNGFK